MLYQRQILNSATLLFQHQLRSLILSVTWYLYHPGSIHHNATATEAEVISKSHGEETTSEWHTAFTTRTQWTGTLLRHQHTYSVIFKIISLPDDDVMNATLLIGDYSDIYITGNTTLIIITCLTNTTGIIIK